MRRGVVPAVRKGESIRAVARRFGVGLATVHLWVERAGKRRLSRVDWSDRPAVPYVICRTDKAMEDLILTTRKQNRRSPRSAEVSKILNSRSPVSSSWSNHILEKNNGAGRSKPLGHTFSVDAHWPHRLVRAEVDLDAGKIDSYALLGREPGVQPLLTTYHYKLPMKRLTG